MGLKQIVDNVVGNASAQEHFIPGCTLAEEDGTYTCIPKIILPDGKELGGGEVKIRYTQNGKKLRILASSEVPEIVLNRLKKYLEENGLE